MMMTGDRLVITCSLITAGHNSHYVQGRPESLVIGADRPPGPALWLDRDMDRGTSGPSNTFDSPALVAGGEFRHG